MKIAFDVHGVLDTLPEYRQLMEDMYFSGHVIYVISGQPLDDEILAFLDEYDLRKYMHEYRSVETWLLAHGNMNYEIRAGGQKYWPEEIWDPIKAEICEAENIDMIFDNSVDYAQTFKKIRTVFSLVIDKTRSIKEKRSKAIDLQSKVK